MATKSFQVLCLETLAILIHLQGHYFPFFDNTKKIPLQTFFTCSALYLE